MGRRIYVDGAIQATTGDLYSHNIISGGVSRPADAEVITPPDGVLKITEDTGSIFDTYYVRDGVAAGGVLGVSKGAICAFADIYEFTIRDYEKGVGLIENMLDNIPTDSRKDLYLQQQYASVFSLMEQFLSCTFVRQTCDREESYFKVLKSGFFQKRYEEHVDVLEGADEGAEGLRKQILYIDLAKHVVYHNKDYVRTLFKAAFNINVNLKPLKKELDTRNDIAHRFGYTTMGREVTVTADDVRALMAKVDKIVRKTAEQIMALLEVEKV